MIMQSNCGRQFPAAMIFVALFWSGAPASLPPQAISAAPQNSNEETSVPAYEIVSIKPASPGVGDSEWQPLPNGFDFKDMPLAPLIYQAYGVLDSQISGLPEWAKTVRYYVSARADEQTAAAWKLLSKLDLSKQQQLMLQSLFKDRCQLKDATRNQATARLRPGNCKEWIENEGGRLGRGGIECLEKLRHV